ncbi:MAG: DUF1559 domain-containing protein [Planctomycetaceae bacterium]|nr:DUF1559 domain-containing protein [Planctomycetaceae bacterium]
MNFSVKFLLLVSLALIASGCGSNKDAGDTETGLSTTSEFTSATMVSLPTAEMLDKLGTKNGVNTNWFYSDSPFAIYVSPKRFISSPFGAENRGFVNTLLRDYVSIPADYSKIDHIVFSVRQTLLPVQMQDQQGQIQMQMMPVPATLLALFFDNPIKPEEFFKDVLELTMPLSSIPKGTAAGREYYDVSAASGEQGAMKVVFCFADERTVVIVRGDMNSIEIALAGNKSNGAAADRLARLPIANADLTIVLTREGLPIRDEDVEQLLAASFLPKTVSELMTTVRCLALSLNSHAAVKEPLAQMAIESNDAAKAKRISDELGGWLLTAKTAATPEITANLPPVLKNLRDMLLDGIVVNDATADGKIKVELLHQEGISEQFNSLLEQTRKQQVLTTRVQILQSLIASVARAFQRNNNVFPLVIESPNGTPLLSWRVAILPELGYDELYKKFKLDEAWDSPNNKELLKDMPTIYALPNLDTNGNMMFDINSVASGMTTYRVFNSEGMPFSVRSISAENIEKLTNIMFLVSVAESNKVEWTRPDTLVYEPSKLNEIFGGEFAAMALTSNGTITPLEQIPPDKLDILLTGKQPTESKPAEETEEKVPEEKPSQEAEALSQTPPSVE